MPKTIHIRGSDFDKDRVRDFLEENLRQDSREEQMTCLLICEEMISRLLQAGNDEVSVSVRGLLFPHVVLESRLPMEEAQDPAGVSEDERIETEIRKDILKQYEALIDRERKGDFAEGTI